MSYSSLAILGSVAKCFVQDVQCPVETLETINQFLLADDQRRGAVYMRVSVEADKPILIERFLVLVECFVCDFVLELD